MKSTHFRLSTLMVLIFDVTVMLAIWHLWEPSVFFGQTDTMIIEFFVGIILFFFTLMVVLGFRPRRAQQESNDREQIASPTEFKRRIAETRNS